MQPVLPVITHQKDAPRITHVRDLLTKEQKEKLDDDLRVMARQRAAAEAASAHIPLA